MKQTDKDSIIENANKRQFTININGKRYPAQLAGAKCDYPFAYSVNELGQSIDIQISWALAARISTGESNYIIA
jgi:hypothetical protein